MSGIIGILNVSAATPGASEVKSIRHSIINSATRATIITPEGGKKVRIVSVHWLNEGQNTARGELYFDDGASIVTAPAKAIFEGQVYMSSQVGLNMSSEGLSWPDGSGPVGAVGDVVSMKMDGTFNTPFVFIVHYREE